MVSVASVDKYCSLTEVETGNTELGDITGVDSLLLYTGEVEMAKPVVMVEGSKMLVCPVLVMLVGLAVMTGVSASVVFGVGRGRELETEVLYILVAGDAKRETVDVAALVDDGVACKGAGMHTNVM